MKYKLICPDCEESDFTRIYEGIILFEGIQTEIDSEDEGFVTTYSVERQLREGSKVTIRCSYCEFEVDIICRREEDEAIIGDYSPRLKAGGFYGLTTDGL
jgi:hypothetical protein